MYMQSLLKLAVLAIICRVEYGVKLAQWVGIATITMRRNVMVARPEHIPIWPEEVCVTIAPRVDSNPQLLMSKRIVELAAIAQRATKVPVQELRCATSAAKEPTTIRMAYIKVLAKIVNLGCTTKMLVQNLVTIANNVGRENFPMRWAKANAKIASPEHLIHIWAAKMPKIAFFVPRARQVLLMVLQT